ncbi:hypothetical protein C8F01DRAFT_1168598 [Mycena amicta]|nr:hypothetical protein C8F01DRAFT_1168598 [Mycena amicta]
MSLSLSIVMAAVFFVLGTRWRWGCVGGEAERQSFLDSCFSVFVWWKEGRERRIDCGCKDTQLSPRRRRFSVSHLLVAHNVKSPERQSDFSSSWTWLYTWAGHTLGLCQWCPT